MACTWAASTSSMRAMTSSTVKNSWKYISWRARLAMRELELSRAQQDIALELVFGAGQFIQGERCLLQIAEFGQDQVNHFESLAGRGAGVDAEGPGVAIGAEVGVDGVGHAALFADGLEEARAHAAAQDGIQNERGVAVFVGDGRGGDAEADLHLFEGLFVAQNDAGAGLGRWQFVQRFAAGQR